jgi:hypothetical protein
MDSAIWGNRCSVAFVVAGLPVPGTASSGAVNNVSELGDGTMDDRQSCTDLRFLVGSSVDICFDIQ